MAGSVRRVLRDRGRIAPGFHADLVVFDPEAIGAGHARLQHDLPGDSPRLTAEAEGVVRVFVGGLATVADNAPTGALPGTVLRSGRDGPDPLSLQPRPHGRGYWSMR